MTKRQLDAMESLQSHFQLSGTPFSIRIARSIPDVLNIVKTDEPSPLFREGEVPYVVAPVVTAHLTKEGPVFSTHFARMSATDAFGELPLGAQLRQEKKMLSTLRGALPGAAGLTSSMRLPDHPSSPEALGSIFTEAYSLVRSAAQSAGVRESTTLSDLAELCRNSAASDPRSLSPAPDDATQTVVTEQGPDTADTRVPSVGGSTA